MTAADNAQTAMLGMTDRLRQLREELANTRLDLPERSALEVAELDAALGEAAYLAMWLVRRPGTAHPWTPRKTARVLELRAQGETIRAIADAVGASERTVQQVLSEAPAHVNGRPKVMAMAMADRDARVVHLVGAGMTTRQIAGALGLSLDQVKRARARARKAGTLA